MHTPKIRAASLAQRPKANRLLRMELPVTNFHQRHFGFPVVLLSNCPRIIPRAQNLSRGWKTSALGRPLPPERATATEPGDTTQPHPSEQLVLHMIWIWRGVLSLLRSFFIPKGVR